MNNDPLESLSLYYRDDTFDLQSCDRLLLHDELSDEDLIFHTSQSDHP